MDGIKKSNIRGEVISQKKLEQIWEELKKDLTSQYSFISEIKMPPTKAYLVDSKEYTKLLKLLKSSPRVVDNSLKEWGSSVPAEGSSAAAYYFETTGSWVIIKRKDSMYSLQFDLRHELLHVYERIMLLDWGDLTEKLG
jgi:hypothetical protein